MMGWVHHHYDNSLVCYGSKLAPADALEDLPGLTTVYLRLPWCCLEPEEGRFDWSVIDAPAQRFLDKGCKIAIRVSCSETGFASATPAWVRRAGAKGYFFKPGTGVVAEGESELWEPDYQDPVFLKKLGNFLAALAARYDGSSDVAFIDVGSFGVWGEGHNFWSTKRNYSAQAIIPHIDLHLKHFRRTLLVANWTWTDHGRGPKALDYALDHGLTFRSDSILVLPMPDLYHPEQAATVWPRLPVVLESQHYGMSVKDGVWGDGSGYLQAVEEYHASYVSIHWWPREFFAECPDLVRQISMRMGYRLQVCSAGWPDVVQAGAAFPFASSWCNAGVAPCYPGGHPAITVKDRSGGIVAVFVDAGLDVRDLAVGAAGAAVQVKRAMNVVLPADLAPGEYGLFVSVGSAGGTPALELPLANSDGHRRYRLGGLEVRARGVSA
jgi:Domain of unknown function (DUF4832)/Beta-galactosidase